jgi:serine/threonine protein kinase
VNPFLADIYALGATLYRLATGKRPFLGTTTEDYQFAHLRTFPVPPRVHRWQIPGWLDRMILKCLEKEPAHRWRSATQMELAIGKGFK